MPYGLNDNQFSAALAVFASVSRLEKVILFGSRAKGNYRSGSDVDLSLVGDTLTFDDLLTLSSQLDDLNQPWRFDLMLEKNIDKEVAAHIKRVGKVIFENTKANINT